MLPTDILNAIVSAIKQVKDWTDDKKVDKDGNKKLTDENYSSVEKIKVANMPIGLAVLDNKLYLTNDNGLIQETATTLPSGGGSGGGSSASITLVNLLEGNEITVAYGGVANLVFEYYSSESDDSAKAYVYVAGVLKKTYSINPGENILDIGDLIGEGVNDVKLTASDIYSNSKSLSFVVNAISLKLSSTFDYSQIFNGDVQIRYTPTGAISKDVHMVLDGVDTVINTTSETGKQQTYTISGDDLYHGVHDITLYLTATVGESNIVSNKLYYSIIAIDDGMTTPSISSVCITDTITQGEQAQIDFLVYDPANIETEISLIVYQDDEIYSDQKRTVVATKQSWMTRDLPVGKVTLEIVYGIIKRSHTIIVNKSDIDISVKQTDIEFDLQASGKANTDNDRDVWENNGVSTIFDCINYESTGWVDTDDGTALRLAGDAKAIIQSRPFLDDARSSGKTIELSFAIRDVNNKDAIAISCFDSNIGFQVKADTAMICSEQTSVSCNYTDEEKINISFVIEDRSQYRLLSVYLNGILSGVKQYPETDNFQQSNAKYIEIGSPYCSIDLYYIRCYNTALTKDEIKNNYIASITDVSEKLAIYQDNDIYDIYGNLSFDKLKNKIPIFVATGSELPTYKGDKKKMMVSFTHNEKPILDYEDSSTMDVQGTSSQFFIRKNYKSKTSNYHMIDTDHIDTNVICLKADYMDSSGSHNTAGANYVHTLYGDAKVLPQIENSMVRTTIYGYPCLVFHKIDSSSTPKFIGKYNYNYEKSSLEAFGFISDYPDAFSVEFLNNTSDACLFHGNISDSWEDDFEYRYPDGYENIEDSGFKTMHSWVVSTNQDLADGSDLSDIYTGVDGTIYTKDTSDYRLAKFKKEFTDYFDMDFALIYYIYGLTGVYMDSFAKNLFLTTFDRQHWYCYWYDLDSSWGVNNEGVKFCTPFVEDIDTIDGSKVFNGQDSTLWVNFRQAFKDEIKERYAKLRSDKLLTYEKIIEYFIDNQTKKFSISIFNEDEDYKYISMLRDDNDASNLFQAQGDGAEFLKYFAKNRLMYLDSKFYAGTYPDDIISLRIYTPQSDDLVVEPCADVTVTLYNNMYAGLRYKANGTLQQIRAEANVPVTFKAPDETFNDTEAAIYGASNISSLGDLSPLYCGTLNVSKATKLVEIIVGNGTEGYSNGNLKELSIGTNKLLKKIDIQNCPSLVNPLAISKCPNVEEIYAQGSSITSVELPSSGYLKKVHLPSTITNLTVTNQQYIEEFTLDGYENLTTLRIEKTVNIPVEDIMLNAPNLNRVRLLDVVWDAESEEALAQTIIKFKSCLGLDANGNNTDKAVVTGRVTVPSISDELYNDIYENFPNLVVDDGSDKLYIINYKDRDGTSLYITRLSAGEDAIDPIAEGYIEAPPDIEEEDYKYEFVGWSSLPTNVNRHYIITAQYKTLYAIKYYSGDTLLYTQWATQGEAAPDPVATGLIETPTKDGTDDLHYIFSGWDNLPTNVQYATSVYAQFANVYPVRFYNDTTLLHTQWVVEGRSASDPVVGGDISTPVKTGTSDITYKYIGWDNIPEEVSSICEVYAQYDTYWAARFWNDEVLYLTEWVLDYTTVPEPKDYFEDYTDPTRESTAQYDYTFSYWDGEWENITEARDFTAMYRQTTRSYPVYFYNMDELLYTAESVLYGSSATYSGATPTKLGVDNPDEYVFIGWNPEPTNIKGETKCYAQFKFTGYLQDDWSTIIANAKNGTATDIYPIGGRKEVELNFEDGTTITADVEIIGHNHDDMADDSGKAPLSFYCKDLPDIKGRMISSSNDGGWETSERRDYCNNDLLNAMPEDLQAGIVAVYKISDSGGDGGKTGASLVVTGDKVWLASCEELKLNPSYILPGQGTVYEGVFSDNESRKKYTSDGVTAGGYWTRSSYLNEGTGNMYYRVTATGSSYGDIATGKFYICFGFCIG